MKNSIERIRDKGNSSLLLQLSERVGNASPSQTTADGTNVVGMTMINKREAEERDPAKPNARAYTGVTHQINTDDDFYTKNASTEIILMKAGVCNDPDISMWDMDVFQALKVLVVGDNCLQSLQEWKLRELECLEKVEIGSNCCGSVKHCQFEVSECDRLKSVRIGSGSFSYWGSFTMKNCGVTEVNIGDGCFVHCESVVFESCPSFEK